MKNKYGVEYRLLREIPTNKQDSFWYSGDVAEVDYNGKKFTLKAVGPTEIVLTKRYSTEVVFEFQDLAETGDRGNFEKYIDNDHDLIQAMNPTSPFKYKLNERYCHYNALEWFAEGVDEGFHIGMASEILDAMEELDTEKMTKIYDHFYPAPEESITK